jgi:hypothetical protein
MPRLPVSVALGPLRTGTTLRELPSFSIRPKLDTGDLTLMPNLTKSSVRSILRIGLVGQLQVVRIYWLEMYFVDSP